MMEILINSSKYKISNKSYQISINKIEKNIDNAFILADKKKSGSISFYQLGEVLYFLSLFRETFNTSFLNNNLNAIRKNKLLEMRKERELNFIEQLWIIINPENNDLIRIDTMKEFLKILFSPLSHSVKEMSELLSKFLHAYFFLSNSKKKDNKEYISPLSEKQIQECDIWSLESLVKEFLYLKDNLIAYQGIKNNKKNDILNNNFTFKPKINNTTLKSHENFEERLKKFENSKKEKIQKKKEENDQTTSKNCPFKPRIIQTDKGNKSLKKSDISDNRKCYERLYNLHISKIETLKDEKKKREEFDEIKEMNECTFKPEVNSYIDESLFENKMTDKEIEIFNKTVERMQEGILLNFKKKYLVEK